MHSSQILGWTLAATACRTDTVTAEPLTEMVGVAAVAAGGAQRGETSAGDAAHAAGEQHLVAERAAGTTDQVATARLLAVHRDVAHKLVVVLHVPRLRQALGHLRTFVQHPPAVQQLRVGLDVAVVHLVLIRI